MNEPRTDTIYDYLKPEEAEACRAYREAFAAEYDRLHDPETDELRLLRYWSELAHAGALGRLRVEQIGSGRGSEVAT